MSAGLETHDGRLPVLALTGPTGVGKSGYALQLAATLPLEIVSVDSAQVFRGLDIGTAKPSHGERERVPHHLIDIRDPSESYSAGEFVRDALAAIAVIHARGRIPLLVGGTLLYLRSLWRGIAELPAASPALRAGLDAEAARLGWPALHRRLAELDAAAAARIHPNDAQRIQRALEVQQLSGQPISALHAATRGAAEQFRWLRISLQPDRAALRERLAQRFKSMLDRGLAAEVQALYQRGDLHAGLPAVRAVGYRQLWEWCAGRQSLDQATELAIVATCQLAKRQLTWLRTETGLESFDAGAANDVVKLAERISKFIEST
jgi:tRNA dimethylallyltransferase